MHKCIFGFSFYSLLYPQYFYMLNTNHSKYLTKPKKVEWISNWPQRNGPVWIRFLNWALFFAGYLRGSTFNLYFRWLFYIFSISGHRFSSTIKSSLGQETYCWIDLSLAGFLHSDPIWIFDLYSLQKQKRSHNLSNCQKLLLITEFSTL